jgi:hypothetical protein
MHFRDRQKAQKEAAEEGGGGKTAAMSAFKRPN